MIPAYTCLRIGGEDNIREIRMYRDKKALRVYLRNDKSVSMVQWLRAERTERLRQAKIHLEFTYSFPGS